MTRLVVSISTGRERIVLVVGLVAGAGVAIAGPRPTGALAIDVMLIVAVTTAVVWAGATAPWWALISASGAAALIGFSPLSMGAGAVVLSASVWVGVRRQTQAVERALIVGASLIVLARAGTVLFFGFTSLVGVATALLLAALGIWRRPNHDRRLGVWLAASAAAYCVVAVGAFAATGLLVRGDLSSGNRAAHAGFDLLKQGEFDGAQQAFADSARSFESADNSLARPWVQLVRLVPIANQHRKAADELAGGAATATRTIDIELRNIDFDTLKVSNGQIDIAAVRALREPMRSLQTALDRLDSAVESSQSPWLVEPLQVRVDDLSVEINQQRELGAKAIRALELAPAMLGADGERVYFVMFTTPAEARGQGGFMGNYAELTVDDGHVAMTAFGRTADLAIAAAADIVIIGPADWLARYGPYGFQFGPKRLFDPVEWSDITLSPNFPSTAQVVAELYPQSGGREIDGVINLDVFALQALVGFVGPLKITGAPEFLTGENTADFLLRGQYMIDDQTTRVDMLQRVAEATVNDLLSGAAPDPIEVGQAFAPLVRERRVMMWARDPEEQAMLAESHIDAALLPDLNGNDGLAITVNNLGASKIDSFLERDYEYQVTVDDVGNLDAELSLTFTNNAPATGLADYVIGNVMGLPRGTSRLTVTVFTPSRLRSASRDGQATSFSPGREAGVFTYSQVVNIAAGTSTTMKYHLNGLISETPYRLTLIQQPLADPETWSLQLQAPR